MCNWNNIYPIEDCYTCECDDCDARNEMNCMIPGEKKTPRIAMEKETKSLEEYCSTESWMENNQHLHIRRGLRKDLSLCMNKSNRPTLYQNVICNLCNETRCNDVAIAPKRRPVCYECYCEQCNQRQHRYCLLPTPRTTNVSEPIKDEESCATISAIHEKTGTLYVERRGTCQPTFCSDRIEYLSEMGYTKFQCKLCRRQLCNNCKKFNILKVLNPKQATEERAGVDL